MKSERNLDMSGNEALEAVVLEWRGKMIIPL